MTDEWDKDRVVIEAATHGPWSVGYHGEIDEHWVVMLDDDGDRTNACASIENASFCARARDGWPRALERIRELEAEVENLRRCCREEVWHWQGDGYDFPESLSCPVIMDADSDFSLPQDCAGEQSRASFRVLKAMAEMLAFALLPAELRERLEECERELDKERE